MTVYDCANELAREMRATREFAVLKEAKEKLKRKKVVVVIETALYIVKRRRPIFKNYEDFRLFLGIGKRPR